MPCMGVDIALKYKVFTQARLASMAGILALFPLLKAELSRGFALRLIT